MIEQNCKILYLEDAPSDAALAEFEIRKVLKDPTIKVVEKEADFRYELEHFEPDIIISDFKLPSFDGLTALKIVMDKSPLTPVIILTGSVNEDTAVDCMKAGAVDYVIKEHIKRLGSAIINALRQNKIKKQKIEAETAFKDREQRYRFMFMNNPQPMWIYATDTLAFLEVNDAAVRHYGYTREEFLSMILPKLNLKEDLKTLYQDLSLIKDKYNYVGQRRHLKKNGEIIYVEISSHAVDYNGFKARHVLINDVTERMKAIDALKYNEEKYRNIFENVQDVFYQVDFEGMIMDISPSVKIFANYTREEVVGTLVQNIYENHKDRDILLEKLLKDKEVRDYEIKLVTKKGVIKDVSVNARIVYDSYNTPHHIDGTIRDISERKKAERQLKLVSKGVEESPVSIVITDVNGNIEYVNPKFTQITGYSFEEAIGKNPKVLNSGYHTKSFYNKLWSTILSGKEWKNEILNKKKNGDLYWESANISSILDEEGHISHFVAIKEDITDKKNMIAELIEAKEKAEEGDRLKTAFLHNISHEIRTPMNAIVGFTDLLQDPELEYEKRKYYAEIVSQSSNQLLSIITDIVNVSTLEVHQHRVKSSILNLNNELLKIYKLINPKALERKLTLTLESALTEKESNIISDKTKIEQIITNLLINALKFTDIGHVRFGYILEDKTIKFFVEDTGIGIEDDMLEKIFDRFYQVEKDLTRVFAGTGLGLSISKAYVELLGGRMWAESQPGNGSTFYFTIPYIKADYSFN